jgi:hypothetical protein
MLLNLKDDAEIIIVVSAVAIVQNKIRGDLGISYDLDALRLIDAFTDIGLCVGGVVITHYTQQPAADKFIQRLKNLGVKVYKHYPIEDYPSNIPLIVVSEAPKALIYHPAISHYLTHNDAKIKLLDIIESYSVGTKKHHVLYINLKPYEKDIFTKSVIE